MKLVLENAVDFKKAIDAIAVLIDEAEFLVSPNGLALKATDPSQISMVDFQIGKQAFKKFEVETPKKIGLDLDYVSQIMGRAKASDKLVLSLDEKNSRLELSFEGNSVRKFSVPLIDISAAELPSPKIEFDSEIKLKAGLFQESLKDAFLVGTHITIGVDAEKFFLKAHSSKGDLNSEISKKEGLTSLKAKNEASSMFPLDYLIDMLKASASDTEVAIYLKSNAPIRIEYLIGKAQITYFLAPRIESQ